MKRVPKQRHIKTVDQLFAYASDVLSKKEKFRPVKFIGKNFTYAIRIEGESWDGKIDVRHAAYVMALQRTINELFDRVESRENFDEETLRVKVDVQDGSSNVIPDFTDILISLAGKMTSEQIFYSVVATIAGIFGVTILTRFLDYRKSLHNAKKEIEELSIHEETKRQAIQPLLTYFQTHKDELSYSEAPIRSIASSLEEDDVVSLSENTTPLNKSDLKKHIVRSSRSKKLISYADGDYFLQRKDYSQGEIIYTLSQGDIEFKAYASALSTQDAQSLADYVAEREITEELPFILSLQINIEHTKTKILHGAIVGMGNPRQGKDIKLLSSLIEPI